jgi:hypothetical protein
MENAFVQIASFNFSSDPEIPLFEAALREAGIHYEIRDEALLSQDPLLTSAIGGLKFFVIKRQASKAQKVYQAFQETHGINTGETKSGVGCLVALVVGIVALLAMMLYLAIAVD